MEIGQQVYVKPIGNRGRYSSKVTTSTVNKIGKKYFYLDGYRRVKFSLDTMTEVSDYTPNYKVYESLETIEGEIEYVQKLSSIKQYFSVYGSTNLTIDQIRLIYNIINEPHDQ